MLCLNKFKEGGVENALFDAPGRGRNAEITDDEKAWIINIACQKPVDLGYSAEVWTRALLTKHINKFAEVAGYTRLSTISQSKVRTILEEADIKPNKITYYCENRATVPERFEFVFTPKHGCIVLMKLTQMKQSWLIHYLLNSRVNY